MTLKYLLIIDFPKFDPLTAAEMALCGNLGPKCTKFIPLTYTGGFFLIQYTDSMPHWRHSKTRMTKRMYLNCAPTFCY